MSELELVVRTRRARAAEVGGRRNGGKEKKNLSGDSNARAWRLRRKIGQRRPFICELKGDDERGGVSTCSIRKERGDLNKS